MNFRLEIILKILGTQGPLWKKWLKKVGIPYKKSYLTASYNRSIYEISS